MTRFRTLKGVAAGLVLLLSVSGTPALVASADAATGDHHPRWRLTFRDHFNGRRIDPNHWAVYGQNDRRAGNTMVRDGRLILRTKRTEQGWTAAGVSNARARKMVYGKYVIRARFDRGYGVRGTALLWPTEGAWPPEVNFFEIDANDPARTVNNLTNHFGARNRMTHRSYGGDFTRWHRIGVIWTPGRLAFTLDGRVMRSIRHHVPRRRMWLGMQTAAGGMSAKANARTPAAVDFEVDWVKIYRYLGPR